MMYTLTIKTGHDAETLEPIIVAMMASKKGFDQAFHALQGYQKIIYFQYKEEIEQFISLMFTV